MWERSRALHGKVCEPGVCLACAYAELAGVTRGVSRVMQTHTKTPEPGCRTFPHPTRAGSVLAEAVGSMLPSGWGPRGLFSASVKQA